MMWLKERKHCGKKVGNISFSHIVSKNFFSFGSLKVGIVWKRVNPFPHNDTFCRPWETSLLKTMWEKEKLLVTSNFSFSVFYPFE